MLNNHANTDTHHRAIIFLINARNTLGTSDSLIVEDLFDGYKIDKATLNNKKQLAKPRLCWCKGSARRKHHFA
jgi:hypothetical protein